MAFQMINADKGFFRCQGQSFARRQTDEHATDKPRPCGGGNRVQLWQADIGLVEGLSYQSIHMGNMGARGNFWHHATIGRVQLNLAEYLIG